MTSIKPPFFEIGPKAYLYGQDVIELAKAADAASEKYGVDIIFTAPFVDIAGVKNATRRVHIFAPHMDPIKPGRGLADILPEATKAKREDEIIAKEKEAKELQKRYFGNDGELAKKRQELIKPIQDNVYNALKSVATEAGYDYIFDKVTGDIIYASEKYDESDVVLKKIIK